ncbi:MAG: NAD(P)/FAD-dependent oxidoreductase [Verrucomicrobiales bacterium]|nr:NAD(P)/FAD-dependent oxidoreductase [Verrucomicrobiales bacterium]
MPESDPVVIIGAGPAGLTAAWQLVKHGRNVIIFEADPEYVGGISRTVEYKGFRFDIGGHRFFSKSKEIEALWDELLPKEGDMLTRKRRSRIYYRNRFFSYPLKPFEALFGLGVWESTRCAMSYLKARLFPVPNPKNFAEWVSNQFGSRLFSMFFKTYTEKVWGMPCTEISVDWAAQRIKGLNLSKAVWNALFPRRKSTDVKTLIGSFRYPKKGPGMLWENCAEMVKAKGGEIRMGHRVTGLKLDGGLWKVTAVDTNGNEETVTGRHVISTAAMRDLSNMITPAPNPETLASAESLKYRDFITVAVILENNDEFDDQWIYIHDPDVQVGRIQNYKAWSPAMVPDQSKSCYGLEYFCFARNDGLWAMSDTELKELAVVELEKLGLARAEQALDAKVVRQRKAYPVYDEGYSRHVDVIRKELEEKYPGLHLIGRNGMHKYNNQDHSMMTAILCVENIVEEALTFDLWKVNEDAVYSESGETDHSVSGLRNVPRRVSQSE